jgi:hypothetical protein
MCCKKNWMPACAGMTEKALRAFNYLWLAAQTEESTGRKFSRVEYNPHKAENQTSDGVIMLTLQYSRGNFILQFLSAVHSAAVVCL